jgi:hypothetical protein
MNMGLVVGLVVLFIIIAIMKRYKDSWSHEPDNINAGTIENDTGIESEEEAEKEEKFFEEVGSGAEKIRFLKISNQFDLMFIKSLLQSAQIPYYIEFEKMSQMRPGMYLGDLGVYSLLYILEKDYEDAIVVVNDYKNNKRKEYKERDAKKTVRNLFEIIVGKWKVPASDDIDGIEIIQRKMFPSYDRRNGE